MPARKAHVGDGVYVEFNDQGGFTLTTENGLEVTNRIVLERPTWSRLLEITINRQAANRG